MHYYLDIGCVSAHGIQNKTCDGIVVVSKESTFEKPLLKNPISIFVEDFDNEMCGLSALLCDCKPYFNHPIDPSINIYYFVDVPHLLKCVRNQVLNHPSVQVI